MKKYLCVLLALSLLLPAALCGCAGGISEADAKAEVERLVEASLPVIYAVYGDGLPADPALGGRGKYIYVSKDAAFHSISGIKSAAEAVFTADMLEIIYRSAFEGVADEDGNRLYALITEDSDGRLMVYGEYEPYITGRRVYDYSDIELLRCTSTRIEASVMSISPAGDAEYITVKLENSGGVWLLDSPTY